MASVIEHQKVARRRRRPQGSPFGGSATILYFPGIRKKNRPVVSRSTVSRSTVSRPVAPGRPQFRTTRKTAAGSWSVVRNGFGRLRLSSSLFVVEPLDLPLYVAVLFFAVGVNILLLPVSVDRIVLSGVVGNVTLPPPQELVTRSQLSPQTTSFSVIGESAGVDTDRFAKLEVTSYAVRPGDTLGAIALRNNLEMDTLISFNRIDDVRRIQAGTTFQIPDRDGLLYTVRRGDGLSRIAADHNTTVNAILDANDLRSGTIQEGQVLFVPGARMNDTELRIILGELFAWPMQGAQSSGFGMRPDPFTGQQRFHNGLDLINRMGTPVRAAASGRVVHVESQIGNYGRFVILRHADGFQTLYAHLDSFSVRTGQTVSRGQRIGAMGNTGRSTGPHLHFSVIHNGTFVNPMRYLH